MQRHKPYEDEIKKLLKAEFPDWTSKLMKLIEPSFGIKCGQGDVTDVGVSKFGGMPDVDNEFNWPEHEGKPLSFLCQINLDQCGEASGDLLPSAGHLYFFAFTDVVDKYPEDEGEFKVIFSTNSTLKKFDQKSFRNIPMVFNEKPIEYFLTYTLPSYQDSAIEILEDEGFEGDLDAIGFEIQNALGYEYQHQILGHPYALQGTVKPWWAAKSLGYEDLEEQSEDVIKKIISIENDFHLLLQIDFSDPDLNFSDFAGDGMAYFGILKKDLKIGDYEKAVVVFQST